MATNEKQYGWRTRINRGTISSVALRAAVHGDAVHLLVVKGANKPDHPASLRSGGASGPGRPYIAMRRLYR